jgi:hypothetical protein
MLIALTPDTNTMLHRGLVLISFVCCALVLASFSLFALDQLSGASRNQQTQIASGVPTKPGVGQSSTHHAQPRSFIDSAAKALTSPFRSLVQSNNDWVKHSVPTLLGLLVYGMGLGYLARFSRGMS